jgi:hypothetical protein
VVCKLRLGFFEVLVLGSLGERTFYRLPLRKASSDPGCKGLLVVNLASASVGLISNIATIGPLKRRVLSADILARGSPSQADLEVPLSFATDLVMGVDNPPVSLPASPRLLDSHPLNAIPPSADVLVTSSALDVPAVDFSEHVHDLAGEHAISALVVPTDAPPLHLAEAELGAGLALEVGWPCAPQPPIEPRRSSRLVDNDSGKYVSVIDKAMLRKKVRMEGSGSSDDGRLGELPASDLIAVAVEDGDALPDRDVGVLAAACDIPLSELLAAPASSVSLPGSP